MKQAISLKSDGEKGYCLSYENGKLVREMAEISFAKHNILCFGRLNRNLTKNPKLRRGSVVDFLESRSLYSTAWQYFLEGTINPRTSKLIIGDFNKSCDKDHKKGLFKNRISLVSITKLDKTILLFNIKIGSETHDFPINIQ